ncbi:MAG TPA: DUF465 domain-containing protein [Candidatus Saccharimonadales bacterium]|jgi:hypothetical protein|nr:DUF465 domain-containing protein [Candidatus Saccharimonadales bacterium]
MVDSVREQLLASHEEFRRLAQEHHRYSQRLDSLIEKKYLTDDEKLEEVRLKKLKLLVKDQMEGIEQHHRPSQAHVA